MVDLVFRNTTRDRQCTEALVRRVLAAALPFLRVPRGHTPEVSVTVVGLARIQKLNKQWRKIDRPTDVLSFPLPMKPIKGYTAVSLGDLFLCPMIVRRKAEVEQRSLREQMQWTLIHGFLHLAGHDHPDAGRSGPRLKRRGERMHQLERRILKKLETRN